MAIYHLSVKTISRSAGRSVTAAAAYRAAEKIVDQRTGEIHDYTHKKGVLSVDLTLPSGAPEWASDREKLWNAAEQSETRKNSTVGREFEIALPDELNASQRRELSLALAREIVERHGCVADVAIHEPGKGGDNRNYHAHILCSTRRLGPFGFHAKTRELDEVKQGEVVRWRERFAIIQNQHLREAGHSERVDHRTLEAQGINRVPTVHLGPAATNYERRTGKPSHRRQELEQEISERLRSARNEGQLERQSAQLERSIIDTSGDLAAAQKERASIQQQATDGRAVVRAQFEQYKQEKVKQERQQAAAEKARLVAEVQHQADVKRQADVEQKRQELEQANKPKKDLDRGGPTR
ncbi:MobQ family relaxase [Massilia sp. DJPM01]|uniref:MobQ family relaxase n=1 Tax=Massilia sp. DJPM01 TaxID=3024404 RepID=UPI00259FADC3|nr:MobQ family relaxase [Massilia sp. DJPM01]MDM5182025.1 MobQ family relaxase [Massilia sp. DJPM01]